MTPTPDQLATVTVLIGAAFLASVGANIAMIVRVFRRTPPIDQTLLDYVRRQEFIDHCKQNTSDLGQLFNLLRDQQTATANNVADLRRDLAEWQRAISYQIGSLDGRVDKIERKPPK